MDEAGITYAPDDFAQLLLERQYSERTAGETEVLRAFLIGHVAEFDRITFNKRVGTGITPDPSHLPAVQRNTSFSSRLRVDVLAWKGTQPFLIECKQRVTPATLGQILTYRHFIVEEFPSAPEPGLIVAGREAVEDAVTVLQSHGVTVYLYPDAKPRGDAAGSGV